jgi:hypothetical protein
MKNRTVSDKLRMQERELNTPENIFAGEKKNTTDTHKYENVKAQTNTNRTSTFRYSDTAANK